MTDDSTPRLNLLAIARRQTRLLDAFARRDQPDQADDVSSTDPTEHDDEPQP